MGDQLHPAPSPELLARARALRRLDDPALIARARAMTVAERLESGFELCRFASSLAAAAR